MSDLKCGDKVKIKPHPSWGQPTRGWAERGRLATVMRVFTPHGATEPRVAIMFDTQRTDRLEYFNGDDLVLAETKQ